MTTNKKPIWTRDFINIAVSNFFIFVALYAFITLLPLYILDLPSGTVAQAGLVTTIFFLSVIIVRPFSGMIIEKFGKKRMLLLSMTAFALSTFSYTLTDDISLFLVLRLIHGISFSIATTVTISIVVDLVPPERRGEGIGYFGLSMNVALVAGPFIALTLQPLISYTMIFILFGIIGVIGLICSLAVKVKDEVVPVSSSSSSSERRRITWSDLFEKRAIAISMVGMFVSFSYASILSFISIYAQSIGMVQAASFFFVTFAAIMILFRPITGRLFDSMGPNIVIIPSLIIYSVGLYLLSITSTPTMLLIAGGLIGLGYGTLLPSFQALVIQSSPNKRSTYATATFFTFFDTGVALGSFILGIVAGALGYSNLYLFMAIFVLFIAVYYTMVIRKQLPKLA
ncbi:MFS transporter [Paenisporosarcina antarctica]|uniref:MFS transporter n=1 Tax=Paenisporosarcina antarctica TaxID=417367 RepID=A0A4P7A202_9BACL|nr:MFS transporter [Paenisporosarcina antarctica]QBP42644.1 MFS transporter [Paenisporosarcina antarctica]